MTKTLADMTYEERAECVGMWCRITSTGDLAVLTRTYLHDYHFEVMADLIVPHLYNQKKCSPAAMDTALIEVEPLFDLPRAWNPDGTPPAGEWEYDVLPEDDAANLTGKEVVDRRWTGEWEEAPNA